MLFLDDCCNVIFLLSIGRGFFFLEYIFVIVVICEMYWLNCGWYNNNVFVGFNII